MREAAVNLPFVLMGAGKASLHHFRCRRQLLDPQGGAGEWGLKPEELHLSDAVEFARWGNAAAACCIQKRGAIPAMPDRAELRLWLG